MANGLAILQKVKHRELPHTSAISLLGRKNWSPQRVKTGVHTKTCIQMLTAALLLITISCKHSTSSSIVEQIIYLLLGIFISWILYSNETASITTTRENTYDSHIGNTGRRQTKRVCSVCVCILKKRWNNWLVMYRNNFNFYLNTKAQN